MNNCYWVITKNGYIGIRRFETEQAAEQECITMNHLTGGGWSVKKILCG